MANKTIPRFLLFFFCASVFLFAVHALPMHVKRVIFFSHGLPPKSTHALFIDDDNEGETDKRIWLQTEEKASEQEYDYKKISEKAYDEIDEEEKRTEKRKQQKQQQQQQKHWPNRRGIKHF